MHNVDLSLDEVTKVEGAASFDVKVRDGKVVESRFYIAEFKRFYTQGMRGKPSIAVPQLLARICGTCSNAHLLCSIESIEKALGITPSEQSMLMKKLTMYGLNIRDHTLHLYLFSLPDMFGKDAFLEFDENIPEEHQILHDAFAIKDAGNYLSQIIAGRSVHALYPTIGGYNKVPTSSEVAEAIKKLEEVRPAVLRTIELFEKWPFAFDRKTHFMALVADPFSFLEGKIISDDGTEVTEAQYRDHLEHTIIPYSHASGYTYKGESYMVGSLARINLSQDTLHANTKKDAARALERFPSTNIYDNNIAQAIEVLHCVDQSIDMLRGTTFTKEPPVKSDRKHGTGIGVVEAPRGTLYHKVDLDENGVVKEGEIIVPTGQNQVNIEQDITKRVEELIKDDKLTEDDLRADLEKLIRAYDPCMSCASHFLKLNLKQV